MQDDVPPSTPSVPPRQKMETRSCKLCASTAHVLYTIHGITYYYCPTCDFLQNYCWEDHGQDRETQERTNAETRERLWPEGSAVDMRKKGWQIIELMTSRVAWQSRVIHTALKRLAPYERSLKKKAHRRLRRLLDFGCGHGMIVRELQREGFDVIGLDPFSPTIHPSILRLPLTEAHFPSDSFDGIFTIETVEHLPDVLPSFFELQRTLRPGGVLLVQTHRLEDPAYRRERDRWFYLQEPKTHVSIYSKRALKRIAARTGFRTVRFRGVKFAKFLK